jgi:hypothetical protein
MKTRSVEINPGLLVIGLAAGCAFYWLVSSFGDIVISADFKPHTPGTAPIFAAVSTAFSRIFDTVGLIGGAGLIMVSLSTFVGQVVRRIRYEMHGPAR